MSKPNKLYVINDVVYPDTDGGKKIVLGRILKDAESFNVNVLIYNYTSNETDKLTEFFRKKSIDFTIVEKKVSKARRILSIFSLIPFYAEVFFSDVAFFTALNDVLGKERYDFVCFETIWFYKVFKKIKLNKDLKVSFLFHNVESKFFEELSKSSHVLLYKAFYYFESLKVLSLEKKMSMARGISYVFLSRSDLLEYNRKGLFKTTENLINHNDIYIEKKLDRSNVGQYFLFPGSLSFPPNYYAIDRFLKVYESSNLDYPVYITGTKLFEDEFKKYSKARFTGFLVNDDLIGMYSKCTAVLSPITTGSGVKVKNIESVLLGVPLVATKFSMIGIEYDVCSDVVVTENEMTDFVTKLEKKFL